MHTIYICVYRIPKRQTSAHVATYVPIYVRRFCTRPPAARLDPGLLRRRGKPFRRKFDFAPPPHPAYAHAKDARVPIPGRNAKGSDVLFDCVLRISVFASSSPSATSGGLVLSGGIRARQGIRSAQHGALHIVVLNTI